MALREVVFFHIRRKGREGEEDLYEMCWYNLWCTCEHLFFFLWGFTRAQKHVSVLNLGRLRLCHSLLLLYLEYFF